MQKYISFFQQKNFEIHLEAFESKKIECLIHWAVSSNNFNENNGQSFVEFNGLPRSAVAFGFIGHFDPVLLVHRHKRLVSILSFIVIIE